MLKSDDPNEKVIDLQRIGTLETAEGIIKVLVVKTKTKPTARKW